MFSRFGRAFVFSLTSNCIAISGVIIWEMCARRQPFAELNNFQIINLVGMGDTTLPMPPGILLLWSNIASACWKREPKQRPTFVQLDAVFQDAERQLAEGTALHTKDGSEGGSARVHNRFASSSGGAGMDAWRKIQAEIQTMSQDQEQPEQLQTPEKPLRQVLEAAPPLKPVV